MVYQSSVGAVGSELVDLSAAPGARRAAVFLTAPPARVAASLAAADFLVAGAFFVPVVFRTPSFLVPWALEPAVFRAPDFFAAELRVPAFLAPPGLRAPARLDGPAARRSAISSAARSGVNVSGSSPRRNEAFVVPSVT